jgi:plasmid stabilization system protein ParE
MPAQVKWRVFIRPRAELDLRAARDWYDRQRAGLGEELLAEMDQAVARLTEHPERHPFYYQGFRRLLLRRFPYKVFYRMEGQHVLIFRVLHLKQEHRQRLAE